MRGRGISYETGWVRGGGDSRPGFTPEIARRDLQVIRDELHCTALRVLGGVPEKVEQAAEQAAALGLEVWFSPYPLDLDADAVVELVVDCAQRAERLRASGAEVVFVAGAELCLMVHGFLPGRTVEERLAGLLADRAGLPARVGELSARLNEFLGRVVSAVREHFGGPVTYASIPLERVDWSLFDIVSVDLYRSAEVADHFADGVREFVAGQQKPVAITEFGTATYRGAADLGGRGHEVVDSDPDTGEPLRLNRTLERDEPEQARVLGEYLDAFDAAGVDSAFVFSFALNSFPHRTTGDPRDDLDLASYGVVKVLTGDGPDPRWEPKAAFHALAAHYGR
ncbi:hypothetical protein [Actinokineospora bangkokensis]|uniref:Abortive infection protein n=1 Tax=Actinokineospora bangkokensis TaxID=1193682 RepID=A0A1Q9LK88_9PSEU|nr:hypothetical protein [Actinokineospora bangkokensis]OLR92413.1 hypothetical protein BJP25_20210 [Actinokineospora bangkokensis]